MHQVFGDDNLWAHYKSQSHPLTAPLAQYMLLSAAEDFAKYRALWDYVSPVRIDNQAFVSWTGTGDQSFTVLELFNIIE